MKGKRIGFAITGSYCTFNKTLQQMKMLSKHNEVFPIFSFSIKADTRFFISSDFYQAVYNITGKKPIDTIVDAEPIGPNKSLDILLIAPCTGNTLAKLAYSITDTPVLMASKAHIRNDRPLVLAVSTNDALSGSAKNIGHLLNYRNIFFVPMSQDDPIKKTRSIVADFDLIESTLAEALQGRQIQPIYK
ncbi:MAG: dipicolinate synthase subunit B [Firmicutes bacterium]|nr:dipicolinate synthase subunit B [Bacillota bacterium]